MKNCRVCKIVTKSEQCRTSNAHADERQYKKLIIINTIQLSLLLDFRVTRLETVKGCPFSLSCLMQAHDFFCFVPPLVDILIGIRTTANWIIDNRATVNQDNCQSDSVQPDNCQWDNCQQR